MENLREDDLLVVYKLDRLGRSTFKLLSLTEELQQRGVEFVFLKDHIDTSSAIGKAMFRMLAVLAEMERELIVKEPRQACRQPVKEAASAAAPGWMAKQWRRPYSFMSRKDTA